LALQRKKSRLRILEEEIQGKKGEEKGERVVA
jgi:hypothetical protein